MIVIYSELPNYALNYYRRFNAVGFCFAKFIYLDMSKGNIQASRSHGGRMEYYLREKECIAYRHSEKQVIGKKAIQDQWKQIERNEINGNRELGIRGRHDAQVRTNYMLMMPNELSGQECIERVQSIIDQTPIRDCVYTVCVHGGRQGEVGHNQHVHLLVNERSKVTGKKDRELSQKAFLEKLKTIYGQKFALEFSRGKEVAPRERIASSLWKASPVLSRELCRVQQKGMEPAAVIQKEKVVVKGKRGVGLTSEHIGVISSLFKRKDKHDNDQVNLRNQIAEGKSAIQGLAAQIKQTERDREKAISRDLQHHREEIEKYHRMKQESANESWFIRTMTPGFRKQLDKDMESAKENYERAFRQITRPYDDLLVKLYLKDITVKENLQDAEREAEMNEQDAPLIEQEIEKSVIAVFDYQLSTEEKKELLNKGSVSVPVKEYIDKSGKPKDGYITIIADEKKEHLKQSFMTTEDYTTRSNMINRQENISRKLLEEQQERLRQPYKSKEQERDQEQEHKRNRGFGLSR